MLLFDRPSPHSRQINTAFNPSPHVVFPRRPGGLPHSTSRLCLNCSLSRHRFFDCRARQSSLNSSPKGFRDVTPRTGTDISFPRARGNRRVRHAQTCETVVNGNRTVVVARSASFAAKRNDARWETRRPHEYRDPYRPRLVPAAGDNRFDVDGHRVPDRRRDRARPGGRRFSRARETDVGHGCRVNNAISH